MKVRKIVVSLSCGCFAAFEIVQNSQTVGMLRSLTAMIQLLCDFTISYGGYATALRN